MMLYGRNRCFIWFKCNYNW